MLSAELADEILERLHVNSDDLILKSTANFGLPFSPVPLLTGALGPEMPEFRPDRTAGAVFVPSYLSASPARELIAARLGEDEWATPKFRSGDMVLIDQSASARTHLEHAGIYIVTPQGGPRVRYARVGDLQLYLPSERSIEHPAHWERIPLRGQSLLDIVRGRVVWVSRSLQGHERG